MNEFSMYNESHYIYKLFPPPHENIHQQKAGFAEGLSL